MTEWCPDLSASNAPRYAAIADAIEADIRAGRLSPGDRLPAQRQLAARLGLDFTTVARGYTEARRRGVISSMVGSGTFVTGPDTQLNGTKLGVGLAARDARRLSAPDFSMNLPPEVSDPNLIERMREGVAALSADLIPLLRYQTIAEKDPDPQAAAQWLAGVGLKPAPEEILHAPGAQAALASILATLSEPGDRIACEAVTYPGIRSICGQLRLELRGLPTDGEGIDPAAFQDACLDGRLKALYLNPTLHNPTTRTLTEQRRRDLAAVAQRHGVPILEDDPYGQLSRKEMPPIAAIAPDVTWYIGSLSKSIGAGIRLAHVLAPDRRAAWQFSRSQRTSCIMISPLNTALATRWIEDGTAKALLRHIRSESAARQELAARYLKGLQFEADTDGFHLWLSLPHGWSRPAFVSQMRNQPVGVVESDAFTITGKADEAVRLCLGGPHDRAQIDSALRVISEALASTPDKTSTYF
ncbi:PLP-dependent aminotransferase family protein [Roseibium sp. FZY0029]|uniref:aminotransferase-like domain-containing protein n=1 Tax=Roseibium sp. FZY0029 TaxID=3116647 RepID=UPI002EC9BF93|nr:PLP-dependent aminotransferase family protein [Roseibium sp. FZY0029]